VTVGQQLSAILTPQRRHGLCNLNLLRRAAPSTEMHLDWLHCAEELSNEDCDEICQACRDFPLTPPSTVGEDRYPAHRQADTRKVGVNSRTEWIFDLLARVATEATNTAAGLELTTIKCAPQYVEYRPGWGHFDWHNDYSHGLADAPRKMTLIIQLSTPAEYEGGRLQIFGTEVEDLPDARGTILAFPSFLFHRVTPVTAGLRRALVAWIGGPRLR